MDNHINETTDENDNKDALTPEKTVAKSEQDENNMISDNSKVSASDNSEISEELLKAYELSREELFQLNGNKLFNIFPHRFDTRLSETQRKAMRTSRQWEEYLDGLKCAVCGIPGGKCDCKIEGDIMTHQKIRWT